MLNPKDIIRLRHMLEAAGKAIQFAQVRSRADVLRLEVTPRNRDELPKALAAWADAQGPIPQMESWVG